MDIVSAFLRFSIDAQTVELVPRRSQPLPLCMLSQFHPSIIVQGDNRETNGSGRQTLRRGITTEVPKVTGADDNECLSRDHLTGSLIEVGTEHEIGLGLVKMTGPKEVRATDPGKILASGVELGSWSLSRAGAVVSDDTEVVSAPLDCYEGVVGEVRNLEVPSELSGDVESSLTGGAGFVIPWDGEK